MKTIVKAIESMLAQDATQQWTPPPRSSLRSRPGTGAEHPRSANPLDRTPPTSFGLCRPPRKEHRNDEVHRRSARPRRDLGPGAEPPRSREDQHTRTAPHQLRAPRARLGRNTAMTKSTAAQLAPVATWSWG